MYEYLTLTSNFSVGQPIDADIGKRFEIHILFSRAYEIVKYLKS